MTIHMITEDQVTLSREHYEHLVQDSAQLASLNNSQAINWEAHRVWVENYANPDKAVNPEQT